MSIVKGFWIVLMTLCKVPHLGPDWRDQGAPVHPGDGLEKPGFTGSDMVQGKGTGVMKIPRHQRDGLCDGP